MRFLGFGKKSSEVQIALPTTEKVAVIPHKKKLEPKFKMGMGVTKTWDPTEKDKIVIGALKKLGGQAIAKKILEEIEKEGHAYDGVKYKRWHIMAVTHSLGNWVGLGYVTMDRRGSHFIYRLNESVDFTKLQAEIKQIRIPVKCDICGKEIRNGNEGALRVHKIMKHKQESQGMSPQEFRTIIREELETLVRKLADEIQRKKQQ